jgi:hypothetical protein
MVAITQPRFLPLDRPMRLPEVAYRRRRLLAVGAALVLAALLLAAVSALRPAPDTFTGRPAATVTYVVEAGDTVWSIAEDLAPGADPRPLVDAIAEANGGVDLVVGQRLVLDVP